MDVWNYISSNLEWIFSGVGATVIGLIWAALSKKKKNNHKELSSGSSHQNVSDSNFNNSSINSFNAESINYQHNIFNSEINNSDNEAIPITSNDLINTKDDFLKSKKHLRTFIYRTLAPARNEKNIIEVRNVTDAVEDKLGIAPKSVVNELKEMDEEGIIRFDYNKQPEFVTPYTRVLLTKKFFMTIREKH